MYKRIIRNFHWTNTYVATVGNSRWHVASNTVSHACTARHIQVQVISSKFSAFPFLFLFLSIFLFIFVFFLFWMILALSCRLTSTPTQFAPSRTLSRRRALPKPAWAHGLALLMTALLWSLVMARRAGKDLLGAWRWVTHIIIVDIACSYPFTQMAYLSVHSEPIR